MDALLLDYNGVVVDDEPLHLEAFHSVLAEVGIRLSSAEYRERFLGLDDRTAFREVYSSRNRTLATELERVLLSRKAARYAELSTRSLSVVPGVADFVRDAAGSAQLAVVSGALRSEIEAGLAAAGIRDCIGVVVSTEDVPRGKPEPDGFRVALRRLAELHGSGQVRVCVIEDSLPGLAAARALGAGCVMITTSHSARELTGADVVWDSFTGKSVSELGALFRPVEL